MVLVGCWTVSVFHCFQSLDPNQQEWHLKRACTLWFIWTEEVPSCKQLRLLKRTHGFHRTFTHTGGDFPVVHVWWPDVYNRMLYCKVASMVNSAFWNFFNHSPCVTVITVMFDCVWFFPDDFPQTIRLPDYLTCWRHLQVIAARATCSPALFVVARRTSCLCKDEKIVMTVWYLRYRYNMD